MTNLKPSTFFYSLYHHIYYLLLPLFIICVLFENDIGDFVKFTSNKNNGVGSINGSMIRFAEGKNISCPEGWMLNKVGGRCFKVMNFIDTMYSERGSWTEAMGVCAQHGSTLATINNEQEDTFVHRLTDNIQEPCWIGLRKYLRKQPGRGWMWVDSNKLLHDQSFTRWGADVKMIWKILPPDEKCGEIDNDGWGMMACWGPNSKAGCFVCATPNDLSSSAEQNNVTRAVATGGTFNTATTVPVKTVPDYSGAGNVFYLGNTESNNNNNYNNNTNNNKIINAINNNNNNINTNNNNNTNNKNFVNSEANSNAEGTSAAKTVASEFLDPTVKWDELAKKYDIKITTQGLDDAPSYDNVDSSGGLSISLFDEAQAYRKKQYEEQIANLKLEKEMEFTRQEAIRLESLRNEQKLQQQKEEADRLERMKNKTKLPIIKKKENAEYNGNGTFDQNGSKYGEPENGKYGTKGENDETGTYAKNGGDNENGKYGINGENNHSSQNPENGTYGNNGRIDLNGTSADGRNDQIGGNGEYGDNGHNGKYGNNGEYYENGKYINNGEYYAIDKNRNNGEYYENDKNGNNGEYYENDKRSKNGANDEYEKNSENVKNGVDVKNGVYEENSKYGNNTDYEGNGMPGNDAYYKENGNNGSDADYEGNGRTPNNSENTNDQEILQREQKKDAELLERMGNEEMMQRLREDSHAIEQIKYEEKMQGEKENLQRLEFAKNEKKKTKQNNDFYNLRNEKIAKQNGKEALDGTEAYRKKKPIHQNNNGSFFGNSTLFGPSGDTNIDELMNGNIDGEDINVDPEDEKIPPQWITNSPDETLNQAGKNGSEPIKNGGNFGSIDDGSKTDEGVINTIAAVEAMDQGNKNFNGAKVIPIIVPLGANTNGTTTEYKQKEDGSIQIDSRNVADNAKEDTPNEDPSTQANLLDKVAGTKNVMKFLIPIISGVGALSILLLLLLCLFGIFKRKNNKNRIASANENAKNADGGAAKGDVHSIELGVEMGSNSMNNNGTGNNLKPKQQGGPVDVATSVTDTNITASHAVPHLCNIVPQKFQSLSVAGMKNSNSYLETPYDDTLSLSASISSLSDGMKDTRGTPSMMHLQTEDEQPHERTFDIDLLDDLPLNESSEAYLISPTDNGNRSLKLAAALYTPSSKKYINYDTKAGSGKHGGRSEFLEKQESFGSDSHPYNPTSPEILMMSSRSRELYDSCSSSSSSASPGDVQRFAPPPYALITTSVDRFSRNDNSRRNSNSFRNISNNGNMVINNRTTGGAPQSLSSSSASLVLPPSQQAQMEIFPSPSASFWTVEQSPLTHSGIAADSFNNHQFSFCQVASSIEHEINEGGRDSELKSCLPQKVNVMEEELEQNKSNSKKCGSNTDSNIKVGNGGLVNEENNDGGGTVAQNDRIISAGRVDPPNIDIIIKLKTTKEKIEYWEEKRSIVMSLSEDPTSNMSNKRGVGPRMDGGAISDDHGDEDDIPSESFELPNPVNLPPTSSSSFSTSSNLLTPNLPDSNPDSTTHQVFSNQEQKKYHRSNSKTDKNDINEERISESRKRSRDVNACELRVTAGGSSTTIKLTDILSRDHHVQRNKIQNIRREATDDGGIHAASDGHK